MRHQSKVQYVLPLQPLCFTENSRKATVQCSPSKQQHCFKAERTNPDRKTNGRIHLSSTSFHLTFSQKRFRRMTTATHKPAKVRSDRTMQNIYKSNNSVASKHRTRNNSYKTPKHHVLTLVTLFSDSHFLPTLTISQTTAKILLTNQR